MSRMNTKEPSTKVSRKLFLNRETVRSLSTESLEKVAGGWRPSVSICSLVVCITTW